MVGWLGYHGNGDSLVGRSSHHQHDNVNGAGHEAGCPGRHRSGQDLPHPQVGDIGSTLLLLSRYVEDEYVPDYRITVDLDFSQKKLRLSPDRQLNLQASTVCASVCVGTEKCLGDSVDHSCGTCPGMRGSDGQED